MRADLDSRLRELGWWPQVIAEMEVTSFWIHCSGCEDVTDLGYSKPEVRGIAEGLGWKCLKKAVGQELWLCPRCQEKLKEEERDGGN